MNKKNKPSNPDDSQDFGPLHKKGPEPFPEPIPCPEPEPCPEPQAKPEVKAETQDKPVMYTRNGDPFPGCGFPYPTYEHFVPAAQNVIAKLRGDASIDMACAAHCGWVCQGFAQSFIPHDHPPHVGQSPTSDEEGMRLLESAIEAKGSEPETYGAIPWFKILAFIADLLIRWREENPS